MDSGKTLVDAVISVRRIRGAALVADNARIAVAWRLLFSRWASHRAARRSITRCCNVSDACKSLGSTDVVISDARIYGVAWA